MNNHTLTAGTPRGFNLSSIPMMAGFPSFTPGAGQFPPFPNFGSHTVQPPAGWPMNMPNGEEMHQGGPMRRGGGRFNNMRTGPYDRRQQPRYANDGRLTPLMGNGNPMGARRGGFGGGGGKWGDGAGAQTVGPKEAVLGRTIKKYDDLDAVAGGGGEELNY